MRRVNVQEIEFRDDYGYYVDGVPFTGIGCEDFSAGRVQAEIKFENGIRQGMSREWHSSGALWQQADYRNNALHGQLIEWNESGRMVKQEEYEFGICTESREWDDDGNAVSEFRLDEHDPQFDLLRMFRKSRFVSD